MVTKISNKQAICEKLIEEGKTDKDIIVLTSDSRGSSSMGKFAQTLPQQFIEMGIAEQNLVGQAAGLAAEGKKPFVASYAAFLTMRSLEQIKVDIAYSNVPVKIIGISGGVSYGPLGMSHHSLQDIAATRAIPNLEIFMPADHHESRALISKLIDYDKPVYVRVERNAVPEIYESENIEFEIGRSVTLMKGESAAIIACGRMVYTALKSAKILQKEGINCRVINMRSLKPLDQEAIIKAARETGKILTLEEHSIYGGLGSAVAETVTQNHPCQLKILGLPDQPIVAGSPDEIFAHYGLDVEGVIKQIKILLGNYSK
ncbi:MAG: transketolase family protein [Bacillota bacterium]